MAPVSTVSTNQMPESVTSLTDDQLRAALLARGLNPGPIVTSTRHLYRKKLAQFMLREDQVEGFDEQVDEIDSKNGTKENEEDDEDYQPSATVVPSPNLRSRTVRRAEVEEEKLVAKEDSPHTSIFSKLCELLIFTLKFLVFLVILGAGFLMYTSSTSEEGDSLGDVPPPSAPGKDFV